MKIKIIVDPSGEIVGVAGTAANGKAAKDGQGAEVGVEPGPGQSVHEADVPDDVLKLGPDQLLAGLREVHSVKRVLGTIPTAGMMQGYQS